MYSQIIFSKKHLLKKIASVLFILGSVAFISAFVLFFSKERIHNVSFEGDDAMHVGPLKAGAYEVEVLQTLYHDTTVYLKTSLYTEKGKPVYGMGKWLWRVSGVDEGYMWSEADDKLTYTFLLPESSQNYYFVVDNKLNRKYMGNTIVTIKSVVQYQLMLIFAIATFVIGILLFFVIRFVNFKER